MLAVAFESYALKNKQDAAFKYRSVFDVFIYKKSVPNHDRFSAEPCALTIPLLLRF